MPPGERCAGHPRTWLSSPIRPRIAHGVSPNSSRISGPNPVFEDSELVVGLVAPVGTNFGRFEILLTRLLKEFGYAVNSVRLSDLTMKFEVEDGDSIAGSAEYVRLNRLMHAGNYLRFTSQKGEFLALASASAIRAGRPAEEGVRLKTVHVLRSLKHPDEVRALRRIYGSGFFLVGVTAGEEERRKYLADEKGCSSDEVDKLLQRDEHEDDARYIDEDGENYGQRTRDTFHLADVFVPLDDKQKLETFLNLVFGYPFATPTLDEYAMFLAFGAALRSGDLSRQVGAVMVSAEGDVAAVGANDVPRGGGGLYWPGAEDQRDHVRGKDSNDVRRREILTDVLKRLRPEGADEREWILRGTHLLKASPLMDITEYGRAVHAEMEALLSCARTGISTRGATLYSTTFPCHNCAKHLIDAGVGRVVYVEPYPKSQAIELYRDSIDPETPPVNGPKVRFDQFVGIGPRRFFDLFSMGLSSGTTAKRKKAGVPVKWEPATGIVRVPLLPNSYMDRERVAELELVALTKQPQEPSQ